MQSAGKPTVGGIVLGAGESARFDRGNKLLASVDGDPIITHVTGTAVRSPLDETVAVLGHEAAAVSDALAPFSLPTVYNADYGQGQSTSVRCGVAYGRDADWDAAVVLLGDMPFVDGRSIARIIEAYQSGAGSIIAPTYEGQRGNPVLFDSVHFETLTGITGDRGGRDLVQGHPDSVLLATDDPGVIRDVDTVADLPGERVSR